MKCANKSSKDWKDLANEVGGPEATRAYELNDNEIPSVEYGKDILKNGVVTFVDNVDPIKHNNIVEHKILSKRLTYVKDARERLDDLSPEMIIKDDSMTVNGYPIFTDTTNKTREELESIIDKNRDKFIDEEKILNEKISRLDKVNPDSQYYKNAIPSHSIETLDGVPKGITSDPIASDFHSPAHALHVADGLVKAFAKHTDLHFTVRENFTSPDAGSIINNNGIVEIEINPLLMKGDTIYHEFGHFYVDAIGYKTPIIQRGIEQLINTPLAETIKLRHPELTKEQFEKELLTTAIGTKAEMLFKNPKALADWNFWINRLHRAFNDILNKITNGKYGSNTDVAMKLAADLVNGRIGEHLIGTLSSYKQRQTAQDHMERAMDANLKYLNRFEKNLTSLIHEYADQHDYVKREKQFLVDLKFAELVTKQDFTQITQALSKVLQHELSYTRPLIKRLESYDSMFYERNQTIEHLNRDQRQDLMDAMHGARLFMAGFSEIDNIRNITQEHFDNLQGIIDSPDSSALDKLNADVYLKEMTNYVNTIEEAKGLVRNNLDTLTQLFNDVKPKINTWAMRYSFNPNAKALGERALGTIQEDVGMIAARLDPLVKSSHVFAASIAKRVQMQLALKSMKVKALHREYEDSKDALKGTNPRIILDSKNRIVSKYNTDKFDEDLRIKLSRIEPDTPYYYQELHKFIDDNTERSINPETGEKYTNEELVNIITDKHNTLDDAGFEQWVSKNFKSGRDNEYIPKYTGDYSNIKDTYLNKEWTNIHKKGNEHIKQYYDTVTRMFGELSEGYNIAQAKGMLAAIANDDFAKETKKIRNEERKVTGKQEVITYMNAAEEPVHQLPFKYIGMLNSKDYIEIPDKPSDESVAHFEHRALSIINNSGKTEGITFDTLDQVFEKNREIARENVIRHGKAVNTDLHEVIPMWIESVMTHHYIKEIENELRLSLFDLKTNPVTRRGKVLNQVMMSGTTDVDGNPEAALFPGMSSEIYNQAVKYIEMQVYGKMITPGKYNELLKGTKNYVSMLGMGYNVFANVKNITRGGAILAAESLGGVMFDKSELHEGFKEWSKGVMSYLGDANVFGKKGNTSKASSFQNALIKFIPIIHSFNERMERSDDAGVNAAYVKKILTSTAFVGQEIGSHMLQNAVMFAMTLSHRAMKVDGKYRFVTKYDLNNLRMKQTDLKNTPEENAAIIAENKATKISIDEEFAQLPRLKDMVEFNSKTGYMNVKSEYKDMATDEALAQFQLRVIAANHDIHGIYDAANRGVAEQSLVMAMALQFRKFMRQGWTTRFGYRGGLLHILPSWDESTQTENVGTYKAMGKFLFNTPISEDTRAMAKEMFSTGNPMAVAHTIGNIMGDYAKFVTNSSIYWHMLTPTEQAGVKRSAAEVATMGILFAGMIAGLKYRSASEDRKKNAALNFAIYQLDAVRTELMAFVPVYGWMANGKQIMANPTATFGMMSSIGKIVGDVMSYPFQSDKQRVFQGGDHKHLSKLGVHVGNLIPGWIVINRLKALGEGNYKAYSLMDGVQVTPASTVAPSQDNTN